MASPGISLSAIARARCPACGRGPVLHYVFGIYRRCPECGLDYHPEPGYYLGAMMMGFFLNAALTIPPVIALKVLDVDLRLLLAYPFLQFLVVGSLILIYARVIWLHFEYRTTRRLDGEGSR